MGFQAGPSEVGGYQQEQNPSTMIDVEQRIDRQGPTAQLLPSSGGGGDGNCSVGGRNRRKWKTGEDEVACRNAKACERRYSGLERGWVFATLDRSGLDGV